MINSLSAANIAFNKFKTCLVSKSLVCVLKLFQTQKEVSSFADCQKVYNKSIIEFSFQPDALANDSDLDFDKS